MSFSPIDIATYGVILVSVVILALGALRAFQIARHFVNRTYRLRAYWGGALMFAIMLGTASNFVTFPSAGIGALLSFAPFLVVVVFLMAFVDQGIIVAIEGDFFHRDILHWRSTRKAVYLILILSVGLVEFLPSANGSLLINLGIDQDLVVTPVLFAYAVGALVIGGRRTPDRTMKKHIRLLGYGFLCFIVSFPLFSSNDLGFLFANTLIIFANFFLYLAVMSLSSFGKVERETGAVTSGGQGTGATSGSVPLAGSP